ncbi:MAG TPA: phosphotransferase family protein [Acidimicrobiia bacterium]|nr:phosphotransferase family protein [Acidimicrobiia bacterium]
MPPEGVDLEALRPWFAEHIAGATGAPLEAELIAGGRSNLTYVISDGSRSWVLRRPPLGHVIQTAHDMRREYTVLDALGLTDVPVPEVLAFADEGVLDAPFYVMERVEGRILRTREEMAELSADEARACSTSLVDVLATLHRVDYQAVGLGEFGRPDGFLARNVARWGKQWQANKTHELPALEEVGRRLDRALPESGPPAIVHGDYRLDNTMLAPDDPGRIAAVLDWEMSTLGDPLTDVGLLLVYWGGGSQLATLTAQGVGDVPGFFTREEVIARYAETSGRDVEHLDFYEVFAMYKLAIIVEGIQARCLMGKTLGEGFADMSPMIDGLAEQALHLADTSEDAALHA